MAALQSEYQTEPEFLPELNPNRYSQNTSEPERTLNRKKKYYWFMGLEQSRFD